MTQPACELEECSCGTPNPGCAWYFDRGAGKPIVVPALSDREWRVLDTLRFIPGASGRDLSQCAHLWSGHLYPALISLETMGLVTSDWEANEDAKMVLPVGYPRRRVYRVSDKGHDALTNRRLLGHKELRRSSWWLVAAAVILLAIAACFGVTS